MIKLSIIVPVFNVEKYLDKCLQSILIQDIAVDKYEVIIVDDGSPDKSIEIAEKYALEFSNIKLIRQKNQGLSSARNSGIAIARGEYIWFVDSDDWIEKNCLGTLFFILENHQSDVFVTPLKSICEVTGDSHASMFSDEPNEINYWSGIDFLKNAKNTTPVQLYIFKKFFLEKHGLQFMVGIFHEDTEFVPRMLYFAKKLCLINRLFYNYLIRERGSITSQFSIKKSDDLILIIKSLDRFAVENCLRNKVRCDFQLKKIGCLYSLLSNLNKTSDDQIQKNFIKKHYWFIKRLSIESIFTFYPRFSFYGILLFIHYKLLLYYIKTR